MASGTGYFFSWRNVTSLTILLMFSFSLSVPNGYSFGPVVLMLLTIFTILTKHRVLFCAKSLKINSYDCWIFASFLTYFIVLFAEILWFDLKFREIDKPSRFIFAIPILIFLLKKPPHVSWLWLGVALGAISAGIIAIFQKLWLGHARANGFIYTIQFGDIAMLLGILCLTGTAWAYEGKHSRPYILILILGFFLGILASLLSGSRGGWIGFPFIFFMVLKSHIEIVSFKKIILLSTIFILGLFLVVLIPQTGVSDRIFQVYNDMYKYQNGMSNTSLGTRFDLWRMVNYMYGHRPIFGYGSYGFIEMRDFIYEKFNYGGGVIASNLQSAHNEILDAAAKRGSIGVLALLGVYLVPLALFSRYRKSRDMTTRSLALGGAMIPICFIDFGMSQVLFTHNDAVMVYPYAIAVFWACLRYRQEQLRWTNSGFLSPSK